MMTTYSLTDALLANGTEQELRKHLNELYAGMRSAAGTPYYASLKAAARQVREAVYSQRARPAGQPLPDGARVRYRTRGKGTIQRHTCPADYPCWRSEHGQHQYDVAFETGPYRGTTRAVWVRHSEQLG